MTTFLSIGYIILSIIIAISIIWDRRSAESTIAWLVMIVAFPIIGIVCFLIFGISWKNFSLIKQIPEVFFGEHYKELLKKQEQFIENSNSNSNEDTNDIFKTIRLLNKCNNSILTLNNQCKLLHTGEDFFNQLYEDIENAKISVHMEFYIWRSDELGEKFKKLLIKKASQGIQIRLIFDSFGSLLRISKKYRKDLSAAGIAYKYFLDILYPFLGVTRFNNRNHRKIAVIDGEISYTGGMNIGVEYLTGGKKFQTWRDTMIRITGDAVNLMESLFLTDWYNSGNKEEQPKVLFKEFSFRNWNTPIQIALSGPDSSWNAIKLMFINIFSNANESIYIQSPYLVPDKAVLEALQVAAFSGVKVKLMMTGIPDKKIPFWAAQTYYDNLLQSGVEIYQYNKGFLHAKTIVVDNYISTVGTTNMDIRSFKLNYEVNAVMYDDIICNELVTQFKKDLEHCTRVTLEDYTEIGAFRKLRNSLCRIFSPIM